MASIRVLKRADGSTAYKILWRDRESKKQTSFTTDSGSEADMLVRLLNANGQSFALANKAVAEVKSSSPVLNKVVHDYLAQLTGIESGTKKKYKSMWQRHMEESIGARKLEFVDRVAVIEWFEAIDRAPKTKKNLHSLLSSCLAWAVSEGLTPENPAVGISSPKGSLAPREAVYLSKQEFGYISNELGEYEDFVELLAGSGLRYNESTALTRRSFSRVDDRHLSVRVSRAWKDTAHGFQLGSPKTLASVRQVTLSEALSARMDVVLRTKKLDELIFTKPSGDFLRPGYFYSYHWAPALERLLEARPEPLLLQRPRVHDIRHSHASWLIQAGVPLPVIQKRLGHTSIKTTVDVYGHLTGEDDLKAADAL